MARPKGTPVTKQQQKDRMRNEGRITLKLEPEEWVAIDREIDKAEKRTGEEISRPAMVQSIVRSSKVIREARS